MKGLHIIPFAGRNTKQFEGRLTYLIKEIANNNPNSVMLFDKDNLLVGETTKNDSDNHSYCVKLSKFTIEYICISGKMCILTRIREKEAILYEVPQSWSESYIYYGY